MPDCVDASMHAMKATKSKLVLDRPAAKTQQDQLTMGHHAVLSRSQQRELQLTWMTFRMHVMQKVIQVRASPPSPAYSQRK